jgi:hypothetical protein
MHASVTHTSELLHADLLLADGSTFLVSASHPCTYSKHCLLRSEASCLASNGNAAPLQNVRSLTLK